MADGRPRSGTKIRRWLRQRDDDNDDSEARSESETDENPRTVEQAAEDLAEQHWNTVVTAVEHGEADAFLDELAAIDDRQSVQDAIAERRDE